MSRPAAFAGALRVALTVLTRTEVHRVGPEPAVGPCIFFANHASHADFALVWSALPAERRRETRPVAALDYWGSTAVRRWVARRLGAVLVDRSGAGGRSAVARMAAAAAAGSSLVLFPEGRRVGGGCTAPFKTGLYHVARACPGAQLVPVAIDNSGRLLGRSRRLPRPAATRVTFGGPLELRPGEGKAAFLERARAAVDELRAPETTRAACAALDDIPAATYSPGRFPSEYHRRWRA